MALGQSYASSKSSFLYYKWDDSFFSAAPIYIYLVCRVNLAFGHIQSELVSLPVSMFAMPDAFFFITDAELKSTDSF